MDSTKQQSIAKEQIKKTNEIHFTRFHSKLYFPFLLDIEDAEFISRDFQIKYELLGKQVNWELIAPSYRNFFPHFGMKFLNPNSTNEADKLLAIVRTYRFRDSMRPKIGLHEKTDFQYLYSVTRTGSGTTPKVLPLNIGDINLHFFETGVVFLEFNFSFEPTYPNSKDEVDFHDIVQCLYRFKELKKFEDHDYLHDPKKKRSKVIHGFDNLKENEKALTFHDVYQRLVEQSFEPAFPIKPFQTNDGKNAIGHFFSYLYADWDYTKINYDELKHTDTSLPYGQVPYADILFNDHNPPYSPALHYILGHGANMYTDEYLVEPLHTKDYLKTYAPYFYRMDGNGAINFVTRNKKRLINFLENPDMHYAAWQKDYGLMFLYLLHERYALMQYTSLTNTLLMQMEKFHPRTEEDRKKIKTHEIEKMSERLLLFVGTYNKFMIRLDVEIASKHEHTNRVYQYYKKQLFIDDLIEDIYYKIDHFKSYSDTLINEQQITFQKKQRKRTKTYGIVIAGFSILNTTWGVFSGFDPFITLLSVGFTIIISVALIKIDS
jgi:hypothetical protein